MVRCSVNQLIVRSEAAITRSMGLLRVLAMSCVRPSRLLRYLSWRLFLVLSGSVVAVLRTKEVKMRSRSPFTAVAAHLPS